MGEALIDGILLVAEADDEIIEPVTGVDFHDASPDRFFADLDHGLEMRLLADPRANPRG